MRNSKTKGFTLIELIVVMAIIGVLAAILVPNMISYLKDSKFSKANANAKQVYQSTSNWWTKCENNGNTCPALLEVGLSAPVDITPSGGHTAQISDVLFDGTVSDLERALYVYMGGSSKAGFVGSACNNSGANFGRWAASASDAASGSNSIFGEYPQEMTPNMIANGASWSSSNPNS